MHISKTKRCTFLSDSGVCHGEKCKKIEDKKHHVMRKLSLQRKVNFQFLILGFTSTQKSSSHIMTSVFFSCRD